MLITDLIREGLGERASEVCVLMGANVADEMARDEFCEATIGCHDTGGAGRVVQQLFDCPTFRVEVTPDPLGVELCGALKNVVALGAGFCDGLGRGGNTKVCCFVFVISFVGLSFIIKNFRIPNSLSSSFFSLTYSLASFLPPFFFLQAAVIRRGLQEMRRLCKLLDPNVHDATFFESCGVADLITTCYGGRNRKCAERFARAEGKVSWEEIEKEELGGQHLQGTHTAAKLYKVLERKRVLSDFPLFCTVYQIAFKGRHPGTLIKDL